MDEDCAYYLYFLIYSLLIVLKKKILSRLKLCMYFFVRFQKRSIFRVLKNIGRVTVRNQQPTTQKKRRSQNFQPQQDQRQL